MRHDTAVKIGSGGMGEVFKAWDPELERFIALKYLRHDDPELVERLLREARAQARIDHPGICKVYEVGIDDGRPYIAMQYVEGRQLDQAAAGLSLEQKVLLVRDVAEAVHAAHVAGLIHRDLKPGNILVAENGEGRLQPYVLDFGIARLQEVADLTLTGQILGTPGYLSPEQARGEVGTLDRRTDVFSLGVILYELLSGERPFVGDSQASLLVSLLSDEPTPLRRRAPRVPRDLETVVAACLEKEPERRYPSARALAEDLGRFLEGEPVLVRRRSAVSRGAARARRHPKLSVAAAVAVTAILVLAGLFVHSRWEAARRVATAQRFGQEVERVESLTRHAFLLPLHDIRPALETAQQRLEWIETEMGRLGGEALAIGHEALGRGHLALGDVVGARSHLEEAWRLGERTPRVASVLGVSLARLYRRALDEAAEIRNPTLREEQLAAAKRELADPARVYLEQSRVGGERPEYVAAWLAFASDDASAALEYLDRLREREPFFYPADLLAGAIHRRLHQEAVNRGDSEVAADAFEGAQRAFDAATRVGRSDPAPSEELCGLWVQALRIQYHSRGGELAPMRDAALAACERALTANPGSVVALLESGRAHRYWASREVDSGRDATAGLEEARHFARRALELDPANDDGHILLGVCHRITANALAEKGQDPRPDLLAAVAAYDAAIRLRPDDYGAITSLATARLHLGADARARGEDPTAHFAAAADACRRATDLQPSLVGAWVNQGIAEGQVGLWARDTGGDAAASFGRGAEALRKAIELNPQFFTAHYNLGEMLVERAEGELRQGRDPASTLDEAEPLLAVARDQFPDWAPPGFLLAKAAALRAEHACRTGGDPASELARAEAATRAAVAVRGDDANGLVMASRAPLVEAQLRLGRGLDPRASVERGLALVERALSTNPNLGPAWLRQAELLLVEADWAATRGQSPEAPLARAEAARTRAAALNPGDAAVHQVEAEVRRRRAEDLISRGEDSAAEIAAGLEAASHALAIDPARAVAHAERSRLERLAGRPGEADAAWAKAVLLDPLLVPG